MTIAAFVLGIVAIVLSFCGGWCSIIALPLAIAALVLSIVAKKKQPGKLATAALVLGIIAVVLSAIFFFTCGVCVVALQNVDPSDVSAVLETIG